MGETSTISEDEAHRWESWLGIWLSGATVRPVDRKTRADSWSVHFDDGVESEIHIMAGAAECNTRTFQRITSRLDSKHWINVLRRYGGLRIHENAWIEKIR